MAFCVNPTFFLDPEIDILFEEYTFSKEFNIPLASNIDDISYEKMVIFSAISEEINACQKHKSEMNKNV
jgi:hypothetical protein